MFFPCNELSFHGSMTAMHEHLKIKHIVADTISDDDVGQPSWKVNWLVSYYH